MEAGEQGEEKTAPQQGEGEEVNAGDTNKPQTALEPVGGDAEEAGEDQDKESTDVKDPGPINGGKEGKKEVVEDGKGGQAEEVETGKDGEGVKDEAKVEERSKTEEKAKEEEKDVSGEVAKGAEKKKEADVEMKDKGKAKEVEKQGKPKRKSGPPSSSLSRPRPSARSIRAAAKNDIIAKFQQGAPE